MYEVPPMPVFADAASFEKYAAKACKGFETSMYQFLAYQHLQWSSPYRSLLLYHGLGTGKTCSAITLAEAFLAGHRGNDEPMVWVVASAALQDNFMNEIYDLARPTCTGDLYDRLFPGALAHPTKTLRAFIRKRYRFFSYEAFYNAVEAAPAAMRDKVIIIDEVQNLRNLDQLKPEFANQLLRALLDGKRAGGRTRLLLLSATPMYNDVEEVMRLFALMLANDGREDVLDVFAPPRLFRADGKRNLATFKLIEQMAQEYVSVVRGSNPLTFAPRLSPSVNGVAMLDAAHYPWAVHVRDGIVPSELGDLQLAYNAPSNATAMQSCNVVYPWKNGTAVGEDGFFKVFARANVKQLSVTYVDPKQPWLEPTPERLGRVGAKMLAIVDSIQRAQGIVMVYSEYVWSGVLPLAIALEHAGFQRYNDGNFLKSVGRQRKASGSYVILSGSDVVSGSLSIADMLRIVNDPGNVDGSVVKVVLLTPVASEGLTLKNVREVHVLDPWYHLNYREQVIGRALRQCAHDAIGLLKDKNVTVFQHSTVNAPDMPADLRAYEIAAGKQQQMALVEKVLRDHALDCSIQRNANYIPRSHFPFKVVLQSSRGVGVPYQFGDVPGTESKCKTRLASRGARAEPRLQAVEHLVPTAMKRLIKYISMEKRASFAVDELLDAMGIAPILGMETLREAMAGPTGLADGRVARLAIHQNRVIVVPSAPPAPPGKRLLVAAPKPDATPEPSARAPGYDRMLAILPNDNVLAKWTLYSSFTKHVFFDMATDVLRRASALPESLRQVVDLLVAEGVFVRRLELGRAQGPDLVGFINIYTPRATLEAHLWDDVKGVTYKASRGELEAIEARRAFVDIPDTITALERSVGFFDVRKADTTPADVLQLQFQLLVPGSLPGSQRGAACMTKKLPELQRLLVAVGGTDNADGLRKNICVALAQQLTARSQLFYPPFYKPTGTPGHLKK
jgi:hypothetical protein